MTVPRGVRFIALADFVAGSALVGIAFYLTALVDSSDSNCSGIHCGIFPLRFFVLLFGSLAILLFVGGYGLWFVRKWSWKVSVTTFAISTTLVVVIGGITSFLFMVPGSSSAMHQMGIYAGVITPLTLIVGSVLIWYLWRPHVRSYLRG